MMPDAEGKCVCTEGYFSLSILALQCALQFPFSGLSSRRPVVEATTLKQGNRLPSVNDIKWRVDVAISTR